MKLEIKFYVKKSGNYYQTIAYLKQIHTYCNSFEELSYFMKQYDELEFDLKKVEETKTSEIEAKKAAANKFNLNDWLSRLLNSIEPKEGDVNFLNRIIRNGGLKAYAKKLAS